MEQQHNNAKYWQLGFFSMNSAATNLYMAMMGYISYYANGVAGFSVILVSFLLTALNVFDGITDPIVGYFLDRTNGKYGKFRPFMLIGNLLLASSSILMFLTTHLIPKWFRLPYFIIVYAIFVIGYTFQTIVAKSGQSILTNNPKQRPVSTYFDSLFVMASYGGIALFVANYLIPKYETFTSYNLYMELCIWVVGISLLCTLLAIIGIWEKDRIKYFGINGNVHKVQVSDYFEIIRYNRPIGMLILAACTSRFAATVYGHTTVGVMLFGIMMQDYSIAGIIGLVTAVPTLFVVTGGIKVAQRMGQKRALVLFTRWGILLQVVMALVLGFGETQTIRFRIYQINGITILFFVVFVLLNGCKSITNNMVVPMIADCSDFEIYRSGKFVPGLMGALFSFVDKIFSALGTAFVGVVLAVVGFRKVFPQISDILTPQIKWATIFLYCGIPILAWCISLIAMRFYKLDKKKMYEIYQKK